MTIGTAIAAFGLLAAATSAASLPAPVPSEVAVYKNWSVGCDNGRACEAISLRPDKSPPEPDDYQGSVMLMRAADQAGSLKIRMLIPTPAIDRYQMFIDGRLVDTGPILKDQYPIEIIGEDALKVAKAIKTGREMAVRGANGQILARISLAGSAASLRYIDTKQKRAGTSTALVAKGKRRFRGAQIALPYIAVDRWEKAVRIPGTAEIVELIEGSDCDDKRVGVVEDEIFSLGQRGGKYRALVLVACGAGAYNLSSIPYIAEISGDEKNGAHWSFKHAEFDALPKWAGGGAAPLLVNAAWDEKTQILGSNIKGRGIGDCGDSEKFVWDGEQFRLVEASSMKECRGAYDWITTWRADIRASR